MSVAHLAVVARRMMVGLMIIALPVAVGLFMLADAILMLLYRDAHFLVSAVVLRIIVWSAAGFSQFKAACAELWTT